NDDLRHLADSLRQRGGFGAVEASFLELAEPSIPEAAARCVASGATCVVMVPYFLSAGTHVRRDLTALREQLAARFAGVDFKLAEPLGRHPLLTEVVLARAHEAFS